MSEPSFQHPNANIMSGAWVDEHSTVGSYTYVGHNCFITRAVIGRYVSIANNVSIGPGEHDLRRVSTSSLFYNDPYSELTELNCTIGNDVWIGVDSVVRRGVVVGNGAIVGANSFVNRDVPPFAVVIGSPARVLRYRFTPDQIVEITRSAWWDLPPAEARSILAKLESKYGLR